MLKSFMPATKAKGNSGGLKAKQSSPVTIILALIALCEPASVIGSLKASGSIQIVSLVFAVVFPFYVAFWVFKVIWERPLHLDGKASIEPTPSTPKFLPEHHMQVVPKELESIAKEPSVDNLDENLPAKDMLLIVDVQNDFITGVLAVEGAASIVQGINEAAIAARKVGMLVVYTRDWHPVDHQSFTTRGGPHEPHCIAGTPGAEFHDHLFTGVDHMIVDFGTSPNTVGYSPLENPAFRALARSGNVGTIYVVGIAFEYCVQACCLDLRRIGKSVIAVEPLIAKASREMAGQNRVWNTMTNEGVIRSREVPAELAK